MGKNEEMSFCEKTKQMSENIFSHSNSIFQMNDALLFITFFFFFFFFQTFLTVQMHRKLPVFFLLLFVLFVSSDETYALRRTLQMLCKVNKEGSFGKCCRDYDNGRFEVLQGVHSCFSDRLVVNNDDSIYYMFVSLFSLFPG